MKAEIKLTPPDYVLTLSQVEAEHLTDILGSLNHMDGENGPELPEVVTTDKIYDLLRNLGVKSKREFMVTYLTTRTDSA
jgi:hypothetical protein